MREQNQKSKNVCTINRGYMVCEYLDFDMMVKRVGVSLSICPRDLGHANKSVFYGRYVIRFRYRKSKNFSMK